eukprot:TRINITY_DN5056_c0_g1_i1.p1 TRINITY_DN5056_c0_g1~~TRINITY_DN5056_c0_g1_i1.p1  ORF type:complete len:341 (-),score=109.28 TRINITY_DN5056_c0_g1_i1:79-1038(-)
MAEPTIKAEAKDEDFEEDDTDPCWQKFSAKYKLMETIGEGGFSIVKKAQNLKTKQVVAAKIIQQCFAQQILEREIQIMKRIGTHPNILQLYDVFITKKNVYLVMELAAGGEVFDHIVKHGEYSEKDAAFVVRQIVDAVKFLHDQGVAHRDLKPQNLLCTSKGPTDVRIADFGLSKIFSNQTMMKTCCGSPEYVAPEVLETSNYDNAVDMWSVGVITYILLTGCFPFWSDNVATLYKKIINGAYRWPSKPEVSEGAKDLVSKLLERDPKKRLTAAECLRHPWVMGQNQAAANTSRNWKDIKDQREKVHAQQRQRKSATNL